jgi:hypothetical protein
MENISYPDDLSCGIKHKYIDGSFTSYDQSNPYQFLSDDQMCKSYSELDTTYQKNNETMLNEMKWVPCYYKQNKNFADENNLMFSKKEMTCDKDVILYRGQNNKTSVGLPPSEPFLIQYCPVNTNRNFIIADDKKGCSVSHQLFNNLTKRT